MNIICYPPGLIFIYFQLPYYNNKKKICKQCMVDGRRTRFN